MRGLAFVLLFGAAFPTLALAGAAADADADADGLPDDLEKEICGDVVGPAIEGLSAGDCLGFDYRAAGRAVTFHLPRAMVGGVDQDADGFAAILWVQWHRVSLENGALTSAEDLDEVVPFDVIDDDAAWPGSSLGALVRAPLVMVQDQDADGDSMPAGFELVQAVLSRSEGELAITQAGSVWISRVDLRDEDPTQPSEGASGGTHRLGIEYGYDEDDDGIPSDVEFLGATYTFLRNELRNPPSYSVSVEVDALDPSSELSLLPIPRAGRDLDGDRIPDAEEAWFCLNERRAGWTAELDGRCSSAIDHHPPLQLVAALH